MIFLKTFDIIIKQSKIASVAQQVEQLIRNQQVAGPNPATSSKKRTICALFIFCKSATNDCTLFLALRAIDCR